jgi:Tat protein secretion system quality control protein TatD with DNase activity
MTIIDTLSLSYRFGQGQKRGISLVARVVAMIAPILSQRALKLWEDRQPRLIPVVHRAVIAGRSLLTLGWQPASLTELALHPKVVAAGEAGLDYFRLRRFSQQDRTRSTCVH